MFSFRYLLKLDSILHNNQPTIIAIIGASASGKTLFANTIYKELHQKLGNDNIAIIKEDAYYRCQNHLDLQQRLKENYDQPQAFEHELLASHLKQLTQGNSINVPHYCYKTHTRTDETTELFPAKVILVEGIMLLADEKLRDLFTIKVFIDTPLDICLLRRIQRDMTERDRSLSSISDQYMATVRPMYLKYIEPLKDHADIIVTKGGKNRMAIEILKAKIRQLTAADINR
jgi:uridine kinase